VRNCPWSSNIWSDYILSLERFEKEHSDVLKVFEDCLAVGFNDPSAYVQVWLTFLSYSRRRTNVDKEDTKSMNELRAVFDRAVDHLTSIQADTDCTILKFYANIEADLFRNLENGRKIWSDILQTHQFQGSIWMEAIEFEKIFGDKKHLRKRLERAMEKTHDNPEAIAKLWLQFEREEGSLEAFDHCRKMIKLKMEKVENSRAKEKRETESVEQRENAKIEKKKEKDKQYRRDKRHEAQEQKKANFVKDSSSDFKVPSMPPPGASASSKPSSVPSKQDNFVAPPPGYKGEIKRKVSPPPGFPGDSKKLKLDPNLSEDELKKLSTVFLSNLDFEVDEDNIASILESSGKIEEVRLVKHPNGKSKGYAFVQFSNPDEAEHAKGRDNELVKGRPMYISECDPERKKGPVFKYSTGLDKKKLFIKGLDASVTKEDLTELFSTYGELSDIRLVTYRNGHSKGIAFAEYKDEVDAAKALVKADGIKLKGKEIEVALSNPPKRDDKAPASSDVKSLGSGAADQKDFGPRGKGRTQLAFVPRSLATNPKQNKTKLDLVKFVKPGGGAAKAANGSTDATNGAEAATNASKEAANSSTEAAKSNNDFRKMLLGSK